MPKSNQKFFSTRKYAPIEKFFFKHSKIVSEWILLKKKAFFLALL